MQEANRTAARRRARIGSYIIQTLKEKKGDGMRLGQIEGKLIFKYNVKVSSGYIRSLLIELVSLEPYKHYNIRRRYERGEFWYFYKDPAKEMLF